MDERLVGFTHPVYNEPYHTLQFIDNDRILKEKGVSDQVLSVFIPSVHFFRTYFFVIVFGLLFRAYLMKLNLRKEHKERKFRAFEISRLISTSFAEKIAFKKVNFFSVFFVFWVIYVFLLQQLLSNNIKTNKVVRLITQLNC